jgi:site-specific recombinase XerD
MTTTPTLIIQPHQLTVKELATLNIPIEIQQNQNIVTVRKSIRGWQLKQPVNIPLEKILATREKGLVTYIFSSFLSERPKLLPFVFANQSLIRLARHFLRHCSGSPHSLYSYTCTVHQYSASLGHSPDTLIADVKPNGNIPDPLRVQNHSGFLDDYIAERQDEGLSSGRVHCYAKHIKTFYRVNKVKIELSEPLSRRVTYKDRAPTAEEVARMLEIADLREKVIVASLTLGAFREETLSKLKYRHVRSDLEANRVPLCVHVEAAITKGKYHDYDTFLGQEAVEYLRLYLQQRRSGSSDGRRPAENLTDESPLLRDQTSYTPRSIGAKQIRKIVHNLYSEAGLLKQPQGRMYDLRVHSLRKFFETQLKVLGVQPDYIDFMMGHTVSTYNDIQSLGIEKLRQIYAASGLSIRPKTKVSKIETLKEMIRALGLNPEETLSREALAQNATTYMSSENLENHQLQILTQTLKDAIREQVMVQMRSVDGGPEGN